MCDITDCACETGRLPFPAAAAARGWYGGGLCVIGCCFGANAALPEPSNPVLSFLSSSGAGGTLYGGLLPELCVSCAYGFAFCCCLRRILVFLIPAVLGSKVLSACTAAAFLNSVCDHAFWLSCVAVGLPGIFLCRRCFCSERSARRCLCVCSSSGAACQSPYHRSDIPGSWRCVRLLLAAAAAACAANCFHTAYSVTCGHCG